MPNPFSDKPVETAPGIVEVTDSILICDKCYTEVHEGEYEVKEKRLSFTCPFGHINVVKNIDL